MAGPEVSPERQTLVEQLVVLPPAAKVVAGCVMLALGVTAVAIGGGFLGFVLLGLAVMFGVPMLVSAFADRRHRRLDAAERARAEAELPALKQAIAEAVAARHNVGRLLRLRGYSSPRVRRWIALECGVVLARGH